jgi:hypothetical protein
MEVDHEACLYSGLERQGIDTDESKSGAKKNSEAVGEGNGVSEEANITG